MMRTRHKLSRATCALDPQDIACAATPRYRTMRIRRCLPRGMSRAVAARHAPRPALPVPPARSRLCSRTQTFAAASCLHVVTRRSRKCAYGYSRHALKGSHKAQQILVTSGKGAAKKVALQAPNRAPLAGNRPAHPVASVAKGSAGSAWHVIARTLFFAP
jgi:hypothetical protein